MRYVITFLFAIVTKQLLGQIPFEGKIIYKVTGKKGRDNMNAELTIYFGKQSLRLEVFDSSAKNQEDIIIVNLNIGKVFTLKRRQQVYEESSLKEDSSFTSKDTVVSIAGYDVMASTLESLNLFGFSGPAQTKLILYTAEHLFYPVPKIYKNNPQLLMVRNNRIVLGGRMIFSAEKQWNLNRTIMRKETEFNETATAYEVKQENIDPTFFEIPKEYKSSIADQLYDEHPTLNRDSLDSVVIENNKEVNSSANETKKLSTYKKKKSSSQSKSSTTKSTLHRKEQ